ncbi:MAG TPA: hypothetical protein VLA98_13995 [Solirubrobacteraceae bacterium]|nr:hypothetical protein [Solirubrobacteraceae bacterium]
MIVDFTRDELDDLTNILDWELREDEGAEPEDRERRERIYRKLLAAHDGSPTSPLGDPPPDLADAWRRYQAGEGVEPWELRKLDEWRAERAQEDGY